jgi:hypothetical protein
MPKIKLKPHLNGIEVGIGNLIDLKISAGQTVEVAAEVLGALLGLGHFEEADDSHPKAAKTAVKTAAKTIEEENKEPETVSV